MREVIVDEKWSVHAIDPNSEEIKRGESFITRYQHPVGYIPSNLELTMAWRIMELEDKLNELKGS